MVMNWPYPVLAQLEQDTIKKEIMTGNIPTELPRMEVLICPSQTKFDIGMTAAGTNLRTTALSYIVNGGRLNKVADNSDFPANGVFVDKGAVRLPTQPPYPKYRIADVSKGDGASNTLMLSETVNAQSYLVAQSPLPSLAASPPEKVLQQRSQMLWFPEDPNSAGFIGLNQGREASPSTVDANPRYGRPSSMHSGGFNVAMCDESVHFFADTVDYRIYAVLMTSHGIKANDPNNPVPANQLPEPDWQHPTHANYPGTKF